LRATLQEPAMTRHQSFRFLAAALALGIGVAASADTLSAQDSAFAEKAAIGNMTEIRLSKIALGASTNQAVRTFAQTMVSDHQQANNALMAVAGSHGWTLPTMPDAAAQSAIAGMQTKTGADFDQAYVEKMTHDHVAAVALFKKEAATGDAAALKAFAGRTLPTLEHHLDMVQQLAAVSSTP
jgi:putative membrane protein